MEIDIFSLAGVILFSSIALGIDLKTRRIPNWLTVSSAITGLIYHIATGGLSGLFLSLGGFATGFGILLLLWLIGGGGGGDVKLMGAVGAWMGAFPTLLIFIGSAVFAVVCTVAILVWSNFSKRKIEDDAKNGGAKTSVLKQTIPYALPVAMAIWTMFVFQVIRG